LAVFQRWILLDSSVFGLIAASGSRLKFHLPRLRFKNYFLFAVAGAALGFSTFLLLLLLRLSAQ